MSKKNTKEQEKKNIKKGIIKGVILGSIIAIIIIAIAVGGYVAYNKGVFNKILDGKANIPAGEYVLIEMTDDKASYSKEQLASLKNFGLDITLEVFENSTGSIKMYGEPEEISFSKKNILFEDENIPYTFSENKLTFEQNGYKLVFEKCNEQ